MTKNKDNTHSPKSHSPASKPKKNKTNKINNHNNKQQQKKKKKKEHQGSKQQQHQHQHQHQHQQSSHHKQQTHSQSRTQSSSASFLKTALQQMVTSAAVQCTSSLGDDNDRTSGGRTGQFDLYLFAQSWAPRFCCISPEKCAKENMEGKNDLSVHGLWPAYVKPDKTERTYPAFCSSSSSSSQTHSRESHEWDKHGTCTGLSRSEYFKEETRIDSEHSFTGLRDLLSTHSGDSIEVDDLVNELGGPTKVAIKTDQHCRLEEITTCWEKLPNGAVGSQITCPDHVLASARNAAVIHNNCSRVWLDSAGSCRFINKTMKAYLKSGVLREDQQ